MILVTDPRDGILREIKLGEPLARPPLFEHTAENRLLAQRMRPIAVFNLSPSKSGHRIRSLVSSAGELSSGVRRSLDRVLSIAQQVEAGLRVCSQRAQVFG